MRIFTGAKILQRKTLMKLSLQWLNDLLGLSLSAEEVSDILTRTGLEVEDIQTYSSLEGGLQGVVVGKVQSVAKHPDADRLQVCEVQVSAEEVQTIVCGASNVAAGQTVVVALPGASLYPMGATAPLVIKAAKIRGVPSHGMICAEDEIGLGQSHDGIMVLPDHWAAGTPAAEVFQVAQDSILEINITPNRVDASCHIGAARDLAAWLQQQKRKHHFSEPEVPAPTQDKEAGIPVQILDESACVRYAGLTLKGIKVGPSPDALKHRLTSLGVKSINNVVDVTNYVMLLLGHPLHAFDAQKIKGQIVKVRRAKAGEILTTLDEVERTLHEEDLVIADVEKPLCLAGVFGGAESGVSTETTDIFLESAWFHPGVTRKMARRHGLHTDASFRFERGANPFAIPQALHLAAQLIQTYAGGTCLAVQEQFSQDMPQPKKITLLPDYISKLAGVYFSPEEEANILQSLGFQVKETGKGREVTVPGFKPDVSRPADLAEEVIRIAGFDRIPLGKALMANIPLQKKEGDFNKEIQVKHLLSAKGLSEMVTLSLVSSEKMMVLQTEPEENWVRLANPLSRDLDLMRPDLKLSMLQVASYNITHRQLHLPMFELGKTYQRATQEQEGHYVEKKRLGILLSGLHAPMQWQQKPHETGFFDIKGLVESVLSHLGIEIENTMTGASTEAFQGVWHLDTRGQRLASIYAPTTKLLKSFDIKQPVWLAEICWDEAVSWGASGPKTYMEISKFPGIRRDIALLVPNGISFEQLDRIIRKKARKLLSALEVFDVYTGKGIPENHSSYALSLQFEDAFKTLREEEVEVIMENIMAQLKEEAGVHLRS
jgi:phenylalanyl-tRNA synthetase beta chain